MQLRGFLNGFELKEFEGINGIYVIEKEEARDCYYYIASYATFKANKGLLESKYRKFGHSAKIEFHHLVERRHLRPFFQSENEVERLYNHVWPCVLLDGYVHSPISNALSTKAPTEVFDVNSVIPQSSAERTQKTQALLNLYNSLYNGNRAFQKIAGNVIDNLRY